MWAVKSLLHSTTKCLAHKNQISNPNFQLTAEMMKKMAICSFLLEVHLLPSSSWIFEIWLLHWLIYWWPLNNSTLGRMIYGLWWSGFSIATGSQFLVNYAWYITANWMLYFQHIVRTWYQVWDKQEIYIFMFSYPLCCWSDSRYQSPKSIFQRPIHEIFYFNRIFFYISAYLYL